MPGKPFQPLDFAMGNRPPAQEGFTEEELPFDEPKKSPSFAPDFLRGITESASDEALEESPKHLSTPEGIQSLLAKGKRDASDEGGTTDSLTSSEKIALGLLAVMPLIGGVISGDDEGALIGAGAAGRGLAAFGKEKAVEQKETAKQRAATTKAQAAQQKVTLDRQAKLQKDWVNNKTRERFEKIKTAAQAVAVSVKKSKTGIGDTAAIIGFMKLLDPGSVVREGEQAILEAAQGRLAQARNVLGKFTKGKRLTPGAMAELKEISQDLVDIHLGLMENRVAEARQQAESQGIDPDTIVPPGFMDQQRKALDEAFNFDEVSQTEPDQIPNTPMTPQELDDVGGTLPSAKSFRKTRSGIFQRQDDGTWIKVKK